MTDRERWTGRLEIQVTPFVSIFVCVNRKREMKQILQNSSNCIKMEGIQNPFFLLLLTTEILQTQMWKQREKEPERCTALGGQVLCRPCPCCQAALLQGLTASGGQPRFSVFVVPGGARPTGDFSTTEGLPNLVRAGPWDTEGGDGRAAQPPEATSTLCNLLGARCLCTCHQQSLRFVQTFAISVNRERHLYSPREPQSE